MKKTILLLALLSTTAIAKPVQTLHQGQFSCEAYGSYERISMTVKQHPTKANKVIVNWEGRDRILHQEKTTTGALRYEGAGSKLVYIQTPSHSVLLDDTKKHVILSDCHYGR